MNLLRIAFKLTGFFLIVIFFLFSASLISLLVVDKETRRSKLSRLVSLCCFGCCKIFSVVIHHNHKNYPENFLIVSNHLSYIDVLVYAAIRPVCFVTSIEMKKTFFLGLFCQMSGCLFVERRSRDNLDQEIDEISEALKENQNVLIFPEGTSTNGEGVLRFKRPLFKSVINAKKRLLPATIIYQEDVKLRDSLCWYGDMTFFSHFINFLKRKKTSVLISYSTPLPTFCQSTQELSELAHYIVKSNYRGFFNEGQTTSSSANSGSLLPIHF